jgi:hypothetical protein
VSPGSRVVAAAAGAGFCAKRVDVPTTASTRERAGILIILAGRR